VSTDVQPNHTAHAQRLLQEKMNEFHGEADVQQTILRMLKA
jgi:hypothetical protein